jgi:hypothetical protein
MGKVTQSPVYILNSIQQFFTTGVLGEIRHSPTPYCPVDIFASPVVGEDNDAGTGKLFAKLDDHLKAAHPWQTKVEYHDVRPMLAIHRDSGFSVTRLPDDSDLRVPGEDRMKSHASEEVVLDEKNAYLFHIPIHRMT